MTTSSLPDKSRGDVIFAGFVAVCGLVVSVIYYVNLWLFDENGLSILSDRLPYWDFTNLWAGSRMALDGDVGLLFDVDAYRAALRAMFTPLLPAQEWSYPPNILLVGVTLATLPIFAAYCLWSLGTILLLHLAIRPLRLAPPVHLAALASPAVFMNAVIGQNGALTAALLIGGLLSAKPRPYLAGVLFGLLTIKPHLGILIPFCLIASGNWRAILSASATAAAMVLATGLLFGFAVWPQFFTETGPLMRQVMEAPYPQLYHANAMTVFVLARSFGAGLTAAYAVQGLAAIAAIATVVWLWLPSNPVDNRYRALLTATLAVVATPYGYSYDAVPMCVAVAFLFQAEKRPPMTFLGLIWLFPLVVHLLNYCGIGLAILAPIALVGWMAGTVRRDNRLTVADNSPAMHYQ